MALNRSFRLRKNSDFQRVRQQGRSVASRLLILAWAPNDGAHSRIGIVVSKRVSKLAVKRNRIKRLLGETVRPNLAALPNGYDLVLTARSQILDVDLQALTQDVALLFHRARLLTTRQMQEMRS